jgi:hypothetical protein
MAILHHTLDAREIIRLIIKAWNAEHPPKGATGVLVQLHFAPFEAIFSATVTVGPVAEVVLYEKQKKSSWARPPKDAG